VRPARVCDPPPRDGLRTTPRAGGGALKTRGIGLGALALVATAPLGAARAEVPRLSLRWSAPPGCPSEARVVSEVDRLLGKSAARPREPLRVSAMIDEDPPGRFRVSLETRGEGGPRLRVLHASSCQALADAAAVIIALAIDPEAVAAAPEPPPPALPPSPPPALPPAAPPSPAPSSPRPLSSRPPPARVSPRGLVSARPPRPPPARRASVPVLFHVQGWVLGDVGSLPGASFAAGGALGLSVASFRIEAGAGAFPSRAAVIVNRPTAGGDVSLVLGSLGACRDVLSSRRFEIAPCLGAELGRLHAEGFGVSSPASGSALWSALKAGGSFSWVPVSRFALSLRLDAVVPLARPAFVLDNVGPVFRSGPVAGRIGLGIEARL
jgi:hypothetical protein